MHNCEKPALTVTILTQTKMHTLVKDENHSHVSAVAFGIQF